MGGVAARRVAALRVILAAYPLETVLLGAMAVCVGGLAMVVLRERVTRWQGVGMVMAMGSVAMIAAN